MADFLEGSPFKLRTIEINPELPARIVYGIDLNAVLMFPFVVTMTGVPAHQPAEQVIAGWHHRHYTRRSTIIFLISAIAFAGLRPFGQVLAQFMMVWQR